MKDKVIKFFQNLPESKPEQFNKAFELYRQSPNRSESTERVLNAMGYSDSSLNNLLYDLQKLHGITDIEKLPVAEVIETPDFRLAIIDKLLILNPVELFPYVDELKEKGLKILDLIHFANEVKKDLAVSLLLELQKYSDKIELLDQISNSTLAEIKETFMLEYPTVDDLYKVFDFAISVKKDKAAGLIHEIIESLKVAKDPGADLTIVKDEALTEENEELKNQNDDLASENEDLLDENEDLKDQLEKAHRLPKISNESIRVEFPFLNEANCPNELKILVADKITAWNEYLSLQEDISKAEAGENNLDKEQLEKIAARAVECFDQNQKIYDELNAYKETGKVLGKHPIFRTLQLQREVEVMTNEQLINYKNSTAKFFSVNKTNLEKAEKAKDLPKVEALKLKIDERTEKLALVNKKLGV